MVEWEESRLLDMSLVMEIWCRSAVRATWVWEILVIPPRRQAQCRDFRKEITPPIPFSQAGEFRWRAILHPVVTFLIVTHPTASNATFMLPWRSTLTGRLVLLHSCNISS